MDILGWNQTAAALFGNWAQLPPEERNWGRLIFLSPAMRDLFVDWENKAAGVAGILRIHAGSHPEDPRLASLVGELTLSYEMFPLPDDPDQMLVTYHAEPGSESATALRPLASWGTDATAPAG